MSTIDTTEARLAAALRTVLEIAVADEPEWLSEAEIVRRRLAYTEAQCVLLEHAERGQETRAAAEVIALPLTPAPALPTAA